jgi:hypothetical protein
MPRPLLLLLVLVLVVVVLQVTHHRLLRLVLLSCHRVTSTQLLLPGSSTSVGSAALLTVGCPYQSF